MPRERAPLVGNQVPEPPWGHSLAIFAAASLVYGLWPSRNHNYADDSLRFALRLTQPHGIIVSHHLYLNAMRALWRAIDRMGLTPDPVRLLSLYAALAGAVALVFLDRLLRRLGLGRVAAAGVLLCAGTAGFWAYAIVGDVYVPALAFLVIGADFTVAAFRATGSAFRRNVWIAIAAFTLAVFHHQANAVYVVGVGLGTLLVRTLPMRRRLGLAVGLPLATGVLSLLVYAGAYAAFPEEHAHGFAGLLMGYGESYKPLPDMRRLGPGTAVNACAGVARALVSTNALFRDPGFTRAVQMRFPYRNVYPYPYLVRHMPLVLARVLVLLAAAAAAATMGLALLGIVDSLRRRETDVAVVFAALPQALFFMWWEAISDEFWIWSLPFIALAAAVGAARTRASSRVLQALAVAVGATTLLGSILPYASEGNDLDAVNDRYLSEATPVDLVIGFDEIQSEARTRLLLRRQGFHYFNVLSRAANWSASDSLALEGELAGALSRGGRVIIDPYLTHPPRSNIAHIGLDNPIFERQRKQWVARLARVDAPRVVWVPLVGDPRDFR